MSKSDEIKDWKAAAQKALSQGRFDDFFQCLPHIKEEKDWLALSNQAIHLAQQDKDLTVLDHFTQFELNHLSPHHQQILFTHLIEALVALGHVEKALSVVVLYENDAIEKASRWSILGYSLLNQYAYQPLKRVYAYLTEPVVQQRIVTTCLNSPTVQRQLSDWLFWLKACGQLPASDSDPETGLDTLIASIIATPHFATICATLSGAPPATLQEQLLIRLFERCTAENRDKLLLLLTAILPTQLQWLTTLRHPFTTLKAFTILQKLSRQFESFFLKKQLSHYLADKTSRETFEAKDIAADLISIAYLPFREKPIIIVRWGCDWLLQNQQRASAFALLPLLTDDPISQQEIMAQLAQQALEESEYRILLTVLSDLERLTPSAETQQIIQYLSPTRVAAEAKQRRDRLLEKTLGQYAGVSNVQKNSAEASNLLIALQHLSDCGLYAGAYTLCQKMAASAHRDESVRRLLATCLEPVDQVTTPVDWGLAHSVAVLFCQKTEAQRTLEFLHQFGQTYPAKNYRGAFQALLQFGPSDTSPYPRLLRHSGRAVLEEKDSCGATLFLADQKLFYRAKTSSVISEIAMQTATILINTQSDDALMALFSQMRKNGDAEFENFFLTSLLSKQRLPAALSLVTEIKEAHWPTAWGEKIESCLTAMTPALTSLQSLLRVKNPGLQRRWVECLLAVPPALSTPVAFDEERLTLLAAIPFDDLREAYLIPLIVSAIDARQMRHALLAVNRLSTTAQSLWRSVIDMISEQKSGELLSFLWKHEVYQPSLFTWAVQHTVQSQPHTIEELQTQGDTHYRQYRHLLETHTRQANTSLADEKMRLLNSHYAVFIQFFLPWQQRLRTEQRYSELTQACQNYFTRRNPHASSYFDHNDYLLQLIAEWAKSKAYACLPPLVALLATVTGSDATPLDPLLERLLQQGAWQCIDAVKKQLSPDLQDHWRIRLANDYFRQNNDRAGLLELKAVAEKNRQGMMYEQVATSGIQKMIESRQQQQRAKRWCDRLLPNARPVTYEPIIKSFVRKGYVELARVYLPKVISVPELHTQLWQKIQRAYRHRLYHGLGRESTSGLILAHEKISQWLHLSPRPAHRKAADSLKEESIVLCRFILDKAFQAFCYPSIDHVGDPRQPTRCFVPVLTECKELMLDLPLRQYFKNRAMPDFPEQHPQFYAYLLHIQPLQNPAFQWLDDLYRLTHSKQPDHSPLLTPKIHDRVIDMTKFLPRLLDGVCELLLKLSKPACSEADLRELHFSTYFPLSMHTPMKPVTTSPDAKRKQHSTSSPELGLFGHSPADIHPSQLQRPVSRKLLFAPPGEIKTPGSLPGTMRPYRQSPPSPRQGSSSRSPVASTSSQVRFDFSSSSSSSSMASHHHRALSS